MRKNIARKLKLKPETFSIIILIFF